MHNVDRFLTELKANKVHSLEELNRLFEAWLHKDYEQVVHSTTKEKPEERYMADPTPLVYPHEDVFELAFKRVEKRKVNSTGEIKFRGDLFYAGTEYYGTSIEFHYDADNPTVLYMTKKDGNILEIRKTQVGKQVQKRAKRNSRKKTKTTSNYLNIIAGVTEQTASSADSSDASAADGKEYKELIEEKDTATGQKQLVDKETGEIYHPGKKQDSNTASSIVINVDNAGDDPETAGDAPAAAQMIRYYDNDEEDW